MIAAPLLLSIPKGGCAMPPFLEKGYTLVETMTVLAIIGIMAALGLVNVGFQAPHYNLNDAGRRIISDLRLVRQKAIAEGKSNAIQFSPDSGRYLIPGLGDRALPLHIQFGAAENVKKTAGGALSRPPAHGITFTNKKAVFGPNGTISAGGTVYLTNRNETLAVTVNLTGRVKLHRWDGNDWK